MAGVSAAAGADVLRGDDGALCHRSGHRPCQGPLPSSHSHQANGGGLRVYRNMVFRESDARIVLAHNHPPRRLHPFRGGHRLHPRLV